MSELNILQRLNAVREAVEYIQKDAKIGGKYTALSHDGLTSKVRTHLVSNGIIIAPSLKDSEIQSAGTTTKNGVPIIRYVAKYEISFLNIDDPKDTLMVVVEAHANDEGDKAPGKALSYATKYAMLKVLSIESGDKEEERIEAHVPAYSEEQKQIFDVAIAEGDTFALVALMGLLSEEAQTGLFNSFQPGAKSSGKEKVRELQREGVEKWDNTIADIGAMITDEDAMGLKEAVSELALYEKRYLAKRLGDKTSQDMGALIKGVAA
ncbi:ERF family protein [Porticoccaceae bacterium]|nr:ERF family protein [Porticoccaceae bacterium]